MQSVTHIEHAVAIVVDILGTDHRRLTGWRIRPIKRIVINIDVLEAGNAIDIIRLTIHIGIAVESHLNPWNTRFPRLTHRILRIVLGTGQGIEDNPRDTTVFIRPVQRFTPLQGAGLAEELLIPQRKHRTL